MALPDLTGLNIQDTYQRVLQVSSSGEIANGTGSLFTPPTASYAISASYAVSSSHEITTELSSSYAQTSSFATQVIGVGGSGDIITNTNLESSIGNLGEGLGSIEFSNLTVNTAENATKISTTKNTTDAIHYLTFVSDNNDNATHETLGTSGHLQYNPNTRELTVQVLDSQASITASIISASGELSANKINGGYF